MPSFNFAGQIQQIAQVELSSVEATTCQRNRQLNDTFRQYIDAHGGQVSPELVDEFDRLVHDAGLKRFDDFLAAVAKPVRYVNDPDSNHQVPIYGALGSDLINPWLAAMEVLPGVPMEEQPAYGCAANALREHVDFAIIGLPDPRLSLDRVPAELRSNCRYYYEQLNPTNHFQGGFDHPLFYATVRMAAKKLFREDHPAAKLSMAELVASEEQGGFGIRSCLLCHNRDHGEVYKRLLGQGLFLQKKSSECATPHEATDTANAAETYLLAARHVLAAHFDRIDPEQILRSLTLLTCDNLERLKPGYESFVAVMESVGCLRCHSSESNVAAEFSPSQYGVYTLNPSSYYKTENIQSLLRLIEIDDLDNSLLIRKALSRVRYDDAGSGDSTEVVTHEGAGQLDLSPRQATQLRTALFEWIHSFQERSTENP